MQLNCFASEQVRKHAGLSPAGFNARFLAYHRVSGIPVAEMYQFIPYSSCDLLKRLLARIHSEIAVIRRKPAVPVLKGKPEKIERLLFNLDDSSLFLVQG